jgi:hypothetical protein
MPIKVCPDCSRKHGCRRLVCECGHTFIKRVKQSISDESKHVSHDFPYPEPGTWIWDRPKGMPPLSPPDALPPGPLLTSVVKEQVSYEGLGFCIYSLIKSDRITDPVLRELWARARATMQEIIICLEKSA